MLLIDSKVKNILYYLLLIVILLAALFLRIEYVDFDRQILVGDETVYENGAENLIKYGMFTFDREGDIRAGEKEPMPSSALQIGYPVIISIIYLIFGHNEKYVFVFQCILSIIDIILMYGIMRKCHCKRAWIIAALALTACYPGFIYNINRMLTEQVFKTLLLLFTFLICAALNSDQKLWYYAFSAIVLGAAVFVRGLAFPYALLIILIILLYEDSKKICSILVFGGCYILTQLWWWVRNFISFHRFILLSDAGEGPKIWGLMPYYLDMASSEGITVNELANMNILINKAVYIRWRIFGIINYLWNDIWDERLTHPSLRAFLWIHLLLIGMGILLPLLIKRCNGQLLLITSFPISFTLMNMIYHGLPRYLYPATPFLFISFAILLSDWRVIKKNNNGTIIRCIIEKSYFYATILFSVLLFVSVFVFSPFIEKEMSQWRLSKYAETSINEVNKGECVWSKDYAFDEVIIENSVILEDGVYASNKKNPNLIKVECVPINDKVVTKVNINTGGGYIYDYITVYWKDENMIDMDENHVYRFPATVFRDSYTVYIDGDVTSLMIVPYVFYGGKFEYQSINVSKFVY